MTAQRMVSLAFPILVALSLTGCASVRDLALRPGVRSGKRDLRYTTLEPGGSYNVVGWTDAQGERHLGRGKVTAASGDSLEFVLDSSPFVLLSRIHLMNRIQSTVVPSDSVRSIRVQSFSASKTLLAVGVSVAAVLGFALLLLYAAGPGYFN